MATRERKPREKGLSFQAMMKRKSWRPLPAIAVFSGDADFFKHQALKRFAREVFGDAPPELRRFAAALGGAGEAKQGEPTLAVILDELRTPSFFSAYRIVLLEHANALLAGEGEEFIPYLDTGFSGGHFVAFVDGKLDGRTRFARAVAEKGWVVECAQPYDRPPPWEAGTPAWESELTHWLVSQARTKGIEMDPRTAFLFHERAGTDLAILDEELEKLATYLASRGSQVADEAVILEVVGDLHEDSIFAAVELLLEGRRMECLEVLRRLFDRGYHTEKGAITTDPTTIAILFMGAIIPRLRSLRRAHAMAAEGAGPDKWIEAGVVHRPFLSRFQRQLGAVPPRRLVRLIDLFYEADRKIKSGGDPVMVMEMLVAGV